MWFESPPISKVSFENVIDAIKNTETYILINTLPAGEQDYLILSTIFYQTEEVRINDLLSSGEYRKKHFIVYGKNTNDPTVDKKYKQLLGLGLKNVSVYLGGLFEWALLQDIYGAEEFPTTGKIIDILRFKGLREPRFP